MATPWPTATPTRECVSGKDAVKVTFGYSKGWAEVDVVDNACDDTVVTLASYRLLDAPNKWPQELVDAVSGLGRQRHRDSSGCRLTMHCLRRASGKQGQRP